MGKTGKSVRNLSEASLKQISIMKVLYDTPTALTTSPHERELNDIAEASGMNDEKEIQRHLYILEGQKLVSPKPAGDLTSKMWHLTDDGVKTFKQICKDFAL